MNWGTMEIDQYKQPNSFIIGFLATFFLFWFPVEEEWQVRMIQSENTDFNQSSTLLQSRKQREKTIYIGNQQLYGLGTVSLLCSIYRHTTQLPRTLLPSFHFKIPLWKHLIEYFGAVPDSSSVKSLENIIDAGQSVLYFPGGSRGFFTAPDKDKMYSFDSFHPKSLEKIVGLLEKYPSFNVSCFSNVGASEMITCLGTIPFPLSLLDGDLDTSFVGGDNTMDSRPIPGITFFIPTSYQRQFLVVSPPLTYKHIHDKVSRSDSTMPIYMPLLKQTGSARADCLDLQHMAKNTRYLLTSFSFFARQVGKSRVVRKSASQIGQVMGRVGKRVRSGIVSIVLGDDTVGPVIKEIHETESEE